MSPVEAVGAPGSAPLLTQLGGVTAAPPPAAPGTAFGALMTRGLGAIEAKLGAADDLVQRFTLGEAIPLHQVTYALEEARLSVELAMQVRGRLLDGYRELMAMQL